MGSAGGAVGTCGELSRGAHTALKLSLFPQINQSVHVCLSEVTDTDLETTEYLAGGRDARKAHATAPQGQMQCHTLTPEWGCVLTWH